MGKRLLRTAVVVHRWLGLVFCIVFAVWFASGIVMVFHRMPEYSAAERLTRLSPLEPAAVRLSPAEAATTAGIDGEPRRLVITTHHRRPVYRFLTRGGWRSVYADDGSAVPAVGEHEAAAIVAELFPEARDTVATIDTLTEPDQWGFEVRRAFPLHKVSLGDDADTIVYVSRPTGEIVLKTDRASRIWGYAGPVLHWFYFRPLRVRGPLWSNLIIYGSLIGCVLTALGLVIGVVRWSAARRYRGGTSASPYAGWMRWHHYAGLLFGLFTFTWTLSGMLSMSPWDWSPGNGPDPDQVAAIRGTGVDASRATLPAAEAIAAMQRVAPVRELEIRHFLGATYYVGSAPGRQAPLLMHADGNAPRLVTAFTRDELMAAARAAMPSTPLRDAAWLTDYDAYYYAPHGERRLPVLRVRFDDPDRTWLYLDAHDGSLVQREVSRSRVERWLYHGLHSLDVPRFYQAAWAWYPVIVALSAGGFALSVTSLVIAWSYLGRRARAARSPRAPVGR